MGIISIAAFVPRAGKETELLQVLRDRLPLLRKLGLSTQRAPINMKSTNGTIIHISEWVSTDAIERAHHTPDVLALWQRFDDCSQYVALEGLKEVHDLFANFQAIDD
jgi:hypothetical protein